MNPNGLANALAKYPLFIERKDAFKTESDAVEAWNALDNRSSVGLQVLVDSKTDKPVCFVFVECDPQRYIDETPRMENY